MRHLVQAIELLRTLFQPASPWITRLDQAFDSASNSAAGMAMLPSTTGAGSVNTAADAVAVSASDKQRRRIAIVGASSHFMDTLLAEPLDSTITCALETYPRHAHTHIQYGPGGWTADGAWTLPLSWLQGIELFECRDRVDDPDTYTELLACDAVFLVVRASALTCKNASAQKILDLAHILAFKPHTTLLVDCDVDHAYGQQASLQWSLGAQAVCEAVPSRLLERLAAQQADVWHPAPEHGARGILSVQGVHFVSSTLAHHARSILPDQGLPEFARIFRASRFAALYPLFAKAYAPQTRIEYVTQLALHAATEADVAEKERLDAGAGWASILQANAEHDIRITKARLDLASDVSQPVSSQSSVRERRGDQSAKTRSRQADARALVATTLQMQFPWWRLLWRMDEMRLALTYAVGRSFGVQEETRLAYEAGRLRGDSSRQTHTAHVALDDLRARNTSVREHLACADQPSLDTAMLRNALASYDERHMGALLHAQCLSEPLLRRREQLLARNGPVDRLVSQSQKTVGTTYIGLGASYTISALGALAHASPTLWMDEFATPMSEALATSSWIPSIDIPSWSSLIAMTPTTAGGVALLASAAAAYYLQGRWTKLKRRFWHDWDRAVEAAEREQTECIDTVLRTQVYGAPLHAAKALREQVDARRSQLDARIQTLREIRGLMDNVPRS